MTSYCVLRMCTYKQGSIWSTPYATWRFSSLAQLSSIFRSVTEKVCWLILHISDELVSCATLELKDHCWVSFCVYILYPDQHGGCELLSMLALKKICPLSFAQMWMHVTVWLWSLFRTQNAVSADTARKRQRIATRSLELCMKLSA